MTHPRRRRLRSVAAAAPLVAWAVAAGLATAPTAAASFPAVPVSADTATAAVAARLAAAAAAVEATVASTSDARPVAPGSTQVAYPPLGLLEHSGLTASVLHPGVVWIVEDSGEPIVRAFDRTGAQVGSVLFEASEVFAGDNRDTESLTMGPGPTLWSADVGDNSAVRETVLVHTTPEPEVLDDRTVTATSYRFTYPDGPRDAEALLVDPVDGRAYIASKEVLGGGGWYAAPPSLVAGDTHPLTRVQDLPGLLTGGEFSPDGSVVALRTLGLAGGGEATLYDVVRDSDGGPVTLRERGKVSLPEQEQGESLAFAPDGRALLVGSEGEAEPIWSVALTPELATAPSEGTVTTRPTAAGTVTDPDDGSGAQSTTARPAGECRLSAPGECVSSPTGVLVLLLAALGVLLGALVAVHRRS